MRVAVLTPVFNDWECVRQLLLSIDKLNFDEVSQLRVVIINDGSVTPAPSDLTKALSRISAVIILDLVCNLGHQRAIALGLAAIAEETADDLIVVMDSDGEDNPIDLVRLIAAYRSNSSAVVVAERTKRSEGTTFVLGYRLYRFIFRVLVGREIGFGNYCAMSLSAAQRLAGTPSTWNHLAATILRSGLPIAAMRTRRAKRYAGTPSTNTVSLVAHGLSALAVFSDIVFARLLLLGTMLILVAVVGGSTVVLVRFATDLAIPGWATTAIGIFAILLVQALLLCLIASVQLLSSRSQPAAIPAKLMKDFVQARRDVSGLPK